MAKKTAAKAKTSENQEAKPKEHRRLRAIHGHLPASLAPACQSLSRHCRDIHNTALHLAKTALDGFYLEKTADKEQKPFMALKPEVARPKGWQEVLPALDSRIAETNAGWAKSHADELALCQAAANGQVDLAALLLAAEKPLIATASQGFSSPTPPTHSGRL